MTTKRSNLLGLAVLAVMIVSLLSLVLTSQRPAAVDASGDRADVADVGPIVHQPPRADQLAGGGAPIVGADGQRVKPQFGYVPNPQGTQRFLQSLPKPLIRQAAPQLFGDEFGDGETVLLYRALYEAYAATHGGQQWRVGAQGIGDCVSWGWAHGCDISLAVDWKLGKTAEWRQAATEAIYGGSRVEARGGRPAGYSDGSYGGAAAKFVRDWGIVFRQNYQPAFPHDLSVYSASRAKSWGNFGNGGQGDNGAFDAEAKKHPVRHVALVQTFEEAAAAIRAGYPVPVCSGQGFSSRRDEQGFARTSGSWSHCMCFIGVRSNPPGLLCLNSWGPNWISGPKWPEDQPDGSFWVSPQTCTSMLRGGDSFAVGGYEGFPYRKLNHSDWTFTDPQRCREFAGRLARYRDLPTPAVARASNRRDEAAYALAP